MASSSGTSSGSISQLQHSGSEGGIQEIMDQKKRKRMVSNRESARRSRMRRQKHLDDLVAEVGQLSCENSHIVTNMKFTGQMYLNLDAENSILKAQLAELTNRLDSLNEIVNCFNSTDGLFETADNHDDPLMMMSGTGVDYNFFNPWNLLNVNQPAAYPVV